jgi:hypothetical protein
MRAKLMASPPARVVSGARLRSERYRGQVSGSYPVRIMGVHLCDAASLVGTRDERQAADHRCGRCQSARHLLVVLCQRPCSSGRRSGAELAPWRLDVVRIAGIATESDVPALVTVTDSTQDPGVVAQTTDVTMTLAAGARLDLGSGTHLSARLGDAITGEAKRHYGPQVDVGLGIDLGK